MEFLNFKPTDMHKTRTEYTNRAILKYTYTHLFLASVS